MPSRREQARLQNEANQRIRQNTASVMAAQNRALTHMPTAETRNISGPFNSSFNLWPNSSTVSYYSGAIVSDDSALGIPAFFQGVNEIANTIAGWPLRLYRNEVEVGDVVPPILEKPSPPDSRFTTVATEVRSLVLRGNSYALVGAWNQRGWPTAKILVHPDAVALDPEHPGYAKVRGVLYAVYTGGPSAGPPQLQHTKINVDPESLYGRGVIQVMREALGEQIALQQYGARFFKDAAVPPLTFKTTEVVPEAEALRFLQMWRSSHGQSARDPGFLPAGVEPFRLSITPEEAQFISSRQHGVGEVEKMLGFPAGALGAPGASNTYQNLQDLKSAKRETTFRPYVEAIEPMYAELVPRGQSVHFDTDAWMRSASQYERFKTYAVGIASHVITPNEARAEEGLPPLAGGDEFPTIAKPVDPNGTSPKTLPDEAANDNQSVPPESNTP